MALTRRHVVLAAVAAFVAWGYLTHWRPALRYLPYAVVAGALATVALQAWLLLTTAWDKQQRTGGHVWYGPRHAAFLAPDRWKAERAALTKRSMYMMEPLYAPSFSVSDSLDVLLGLALRDFVKSWYGNISKSPTFVNEVDRAVRAALGEIRDRVLQVDMVETIVSRMIPLITEHLRAAYDAERVVRGRKLSRNVTESEELDLAIAAKYKDGRLHPAASLAYSNTKLVQQQHLRAIVARLLPQIMPRNMTTSPAVNVLVKEIVACAVLSPVMLMLADPDTWNQLMDGYVRSAPPSTGLADRTRDARCCRNGKQSRNCALSWTSMHPCRPSRPRMCNSQNSRPVTTSESSKDSSGPFARQTPLPTLAAFAVKSPASCGRIRWLKARTPSIFAAWRRRGESWIRRLPI